MLIKCGQCQAFVITNERYGQGQCHRHAPVPAEREDVLWPRRLATEPGCFDGIPVPRVDEPTIPAEVRSDVQQPKPEVKAEEW